MGVFGSTSLIQSLVFHQQYRFMRIHNAWSSFRNAKVWYYCLLTIAICKQTARNYFKHYLLEEILFCFECCFLVIYTVIHAEKQGKIFCKKNGTFAEGIFHRGEKNDWNLMVSRKWQKQSPEPETGGVLLKKDVLRYLEKFTGKHLCQRLFFYKTLTLLKKSLWHKCFPVNAVKFLRTLCFTEHLWATASETGKIYLQL